MSIPAASELRVAAAAAAVPVPVTGADVATEVVAELTRGRNTPALQQVDAARMAVLGAASQMRAAPAARAAAARRDVSAAERALDAAVRSAREQEQALPGAFIPVRRTH